jgi:hypothetical protein
MAGTRILRETAPERAQEITDPSSEALSAKEE